MNELTTPTVIQPAVTVVTDLTPLYALATTLLTTLGSVALAWLAYKQTQLTRTMERLHESTNSKMDQLMAAAVAAAEARGQIAGRAAQKQETEALRTDPSR
jgi:hypothetical protein